VLSPDVLFTLVDPSASDTTRLWVVGKYRESEDPAELNGKLVFHFTKNKLGFLDLSNFNAAPELPDNWSLVVAPAESFPAGFPPPQLEKTENGVCVKAFQLRMNTGKGPVLPLNDLRKPLAGAVDVWKNMDNAAQGAL